MSLRVFPSSDCRRRCALNANYTVPLWGPGTLWGPHRQPSHRPTSIHLLLAQDPTHMHSFQKALAWKMVSFRHLCRAGLGGMRGGEQQFQRAGDTPIFSPRAQLGGGESRHLPENPQNRGPSNVHRLLPLQFSCSLSLSWQEKMESGDFTLPFS